MRQLRYCSLPLRFKFHDFDHSYKRVNNPSNVQGEIDETQPQGEDAPPTASYRPSRFAYSFLCKCCLRPNAVSKQACENCSRGPKFNCTVMER